MINPEDASIIYAILGGLILLYLLRPSKPRFPPPPKPWAQFDRHGVLWNRDSSGLTTGKPQDALQMFPSADNAYTIMAAACEKGGARLTAGKRKLIRRHWVNLNGKQVEKLTLADEYDWSTRRARPSRGSHAVLTRAPCASRSPSQ